MYSVEVQHKSIIKLTVSGLSTVLLNYIHVHVHCTYNTHVYMYMYVHNCVNSTIGGERKETEQTQNTATYMEIHVYSTLAERVGKTLIPTQTNKRIHVYARTTWFKIQKRTF